jgi:hypothetical protein
MSFIDAFERKFLFVLTRGLLLIFIFGLLGAIVIGGVIVGSKLNRSTAVSPREVVDTVSPPRPNKPVGVSSSPSSKVASPPSETKLPFVLQKHLSSRIPELRDLLVRLEDDQRQVFVEELAAAVTEAENRGVDPAKAIDTYVKLKFDKLERGNVTPIEMASILMPYAGVAFGAILLIALFSMILVLLAVERNTRRGVA